MAKKSWEMGVSEHRIERDYDIMHFKGRPVRTPSVQRVSLLLDFIGEPPTDIDIRDLMGRRVRVTLLDD